MNWKEGYAQSFELQPHLEVAKKKIIEDGREKETICKICEDAIHTKEKCVRLLIKPKPISPEIYPVGGYYYYVCLNCDNKLENLPDKPL